MQKLISNPLFKIIHFPKTYSLGDSAICIAFQNEFDEHLYQTLFHLKKYLDKHPFDGYIESVLTFTEVCVYVSLCDFQAQNTLVSYIEQHIQPFFFRTSSFLAEPTRLWNIPVHYEGEDLAWVADYCQLSTAEIIRLHTEPIYKIYMIGFLPGFPYLGGLDERLTVPRKPTPRTLVKAGSVGLAGVQTGIYPLDSPGGWQLIGYSDFCLFEPTKNPAVTLRAGDNVKFYAV